MTTTGEGIQGEGALEAGGTTPRFEPAGLQHAHRLLGPRVAYLIGSIRLDGTSHLCSATNVTSVGNSPEIVAVALCPEWETAENLRREGEMTINLMDSLYVDQIWIAGSRYSGVEVAPSDDKFIVAGLHKKMSATVRPAAVLEALAVLECRTVRIVEDLSDHTVFFAEVIAACYRSTYFTEEGQLDVVQAHPAMQLSGDRFAHAVPAGSPDTRRCNQIVKDNRSGREGGPAAPESSTVI